MDAKPPPMEETNFLQSFQDAWNDSGPSTEESYADETDSPSLNALIRAGRMFLDDRASPAEFFEELRLMTGRLESTMLGYHGQSAKAGLEEIRQALLDLAEYFSTRDIGWVEQGLERLKAAWEGLNGRMSFEPPSRDPAQPIPCRLCGQPNAPGGETCWRCGSLLPPGPAAEGEEGLLPTEVLGLVAGCGQVLAGIWPLETWRRSALSLLAALRNTREQAHNLVQASLPRASEPMRELGASLGASLQEAGDILEVMAGWDGTMSGIDPGWADLGKALRRGRKAGEVFWDAATALTGPG